MKKPAKTARVAGRSTSSTVSVGLTKRSPAKSRGRAAKAPKSAPRLSALITEAGATLAQYAHLQAGSDLAKAPCVADADVEDIYDLASHDVAPELPTAERMLQDVLRAGWGPIAKPLYIGLIRAGMTYLEANAVVRDAIRVGLIVQRKGGGWTSWANKSWRAA